MGVTNDISFGYIFVWENFRIQWFNKGAFMSYRNYEMRTRKKRSRPHRTRNYNLWTEFSESCVTAAPHAEPEENGGTFKESCYCSTKRGI